MWWESVNSFIFQYKTLLSLGFLALILLGIGYLCLRAHSLKQILKEAPAAYCLCHQKTFAIFAYSPTLPTMLQEGGEAPPLKTLSSLILQFSPAHRTMLERAVKDLNPGQMLSLKLSLLSSIPRVISVSGRLYGKRKVLLWFQDITEQEAIVSRSTQQEEKIRHLQHILDHLPLPVWQRDIQSGQIQYINNMYADLLGKDKREILQKQLDLSRFSRQFKSWEDPTPPQHFIIDGTRRFFAFHEKKILEGVPQRLGVALDITQVEELEHDLQHHIEEEQEVLEHVSTGIAVYDANTKLKYFNQAYAKMVEPLESFLYTGPTFSELLDELRRIRFLPGVADFPAFKKNCIALFTSLVESIEELIHLPNGKTYRQIIAPRPLGGLVFLFEDVTHTLTLETQYNTLIAVQKATIDHFYEGIAVFSSDNRLKISNPAFAKIWNLDSELCMPGTPLVTLLDAAKESFLRRNEWEALKEEILHNIADRQKRERKIDLLNDRVIQFAYVPLPDGANMLSYLDVTDSARVERALRERSEALEAADKLKSKFIATVSYEHRSPLNTIIGFTEILLNEYYGPLNAQQKEYAQGILTSSHQLLTLINDILELASIEAGRIPLKHDLVDINVLLKNTLGELDLTAHDHGHKLQLECTPTSQQLVGDEKQIGQVFYNLIKNIIKLTSSPSTISIHTHQEREYLVIAICDPEADSQEQERVCREFKKLSSSRTGAGLELALVKDFFDLHQGSLQVLSEPEKGIKIVCRLPFVSKILPALH